MDQIVNRPRVDTPRSIEPALDLGDHGDVRRACMLPRAPVATVVLLAVGFSALIGMVFRFFPALRGVRLDPIAAVRHE